MQQESSIVILDMGDEHQVSLTRGSLLCPFSGREGVKRLRWLLRFSGSRSLRHLPKLGGEQGGIEVASALQGAGIDDQVGQGVEVTHRVEVAYFGPLDAQCFALAVDALGTGALGVDALVERTLAIQRHTHLSA